MRKIEDEGRAQRWSRRDFLKSLSIAAATPPMKRLGDAWNIASGNNDTFVKGIDDAAERLANPDLNRFISELRIAIRGRVVDQTIDNRAKIHEVSFRTLKTKHVVKGQSEQMRILRAILDKRTKNSDILSLAAIVGPSAAGIALAQRTRNINFAIAGICTSLGLSNTACGPSEGLPQLASPTKALVSAVADQIKTPSPTSQPQAVVTPFASSEVTVTVQNNNGNIFASSTPAPGNKNPTPEATATWSISRSELPKLNEQTWISFSKTNKEKKETEGNVKFREMYKIVGAVGKRHRHMVDMNFNGISVAAYTDTDLGTKNDHNPERKLMVDLLNKDEELRAEIEEAAQAIVDNLQTKPKFNASDYVVIVDKPKSNDIYPPPRHHVTQIVKMDGSERYWIKGLVNSNGGVMLEQFAKPGERKMDSTNPEVSEFSLLPRLAFNENGEMVRVDLKDDDPDKKVSLEGVVTVGPIDSYGLHPIEATFKNMRIAKLMGANIVRFNIVPSRALRDFDKTLKIVEEAERIGMRVMFSPGSKSEASKVFNDLDFPDDTIKAQVAELAKRLNPYDNVIYDLWYECKVKDYTRLPELTAIQNSMIQAIRENNRHGLIGITSMNNNQYYPSDGVYPTDDKIMYKVNDNMFDYIAPDPKNTKLDLDSRALWRNIENTNIPIFYNEFNFAAAPTDDQLIREIPHIQTTIDSIAKRRYKSHSTGYQILESEHPSNLVTYDPKKGYQIFEDIAPQLKDIYFTKRGFIVALSILGYLIPVGKQVFDDKGKLLITSNDLVVKGNATQFDQ